MLENLINSPVLYSLSITLFHFLWQGALIAVLLKSFLSFVSVKHAQIRYVASSVAMVANLLLPIITFSIIYQPNNIGGNSNVVNELSEGPLLGLSTHINATWQSNIVEYLPYVSILWLATVVFLSSKLLIELYSVNRLPHSKTVPISEGLNRRFNELAAQIKVKTNVKLLISLKVKVPMAIGWLRPVVLIPATMVTGLTPAQLDMLILHELAHIRRHDYLVNFIQTIVELLLFFHPAVHWVSKQMRNEREYCSDDLAVKHCGNPLAYAHTLADTATLCQRHRNLSIPSFAMAASGGDLKQRVVRLVDHHHCTSKNTAGKWLASTAVLITVTLLSFSQFLVFPVIDLQSGQIYLKGVSEQERKVELPIAPAPELLRTTIAKQLLIDDEKVNETIVKNETAEKVITNTPVAEPVENKFALETKVVTAKTKTPVKAKPAITPKTKDIGTQALSEDSKVIAKKAIEITPSAIEAEVSTPAQSVLAQNKAVPKKNTPEPASISEVAFERTNSKLPQSKLSNPYANQIASLQEDKTSASTFNAKIQSTVNRDFPLNETIPAPSSRESIKPMRTEAKLIHSIDPKYPSAAKRRGLELDLLVNFTIDKNGRVKDVEFERKNKSTYFRSVIKSAMTKWRFLPAKENGSAVESRMTKIFSFNLQD